MIFIESPWAVLLLFSPETWIILLAPSVLLAAIATARRTWLWGHTVAFSIGHPALAVAIDYWDVYVLGQMDEKFRNAPIIAFEIGLLGAGVFSALGSAIFLIGLVLRWRIRGINLPACRWPFSFAFGMLTALGDRALYSLFGRTGFYAPIVWAWIFAFPFGSTFLLPGSRVKRLKNSPPANN